MLITFDQEYHNLVPEGNFIEILISSNFKYIYRYLRIKFRLEPNLFKQPVFFFVIVIYIYIYIGYNDNENKDLFRS